MRRKRAEKRAQAAGAPRPGSAAPRPGSASPRSGSAARLPASTTAPGSDGPRDRLTAPRGVLALAAFALAVRLLRVAHGLPEFFEEAIPLRRALRMWIGPSGHVDWNPHLFHY